MIKSFKETANLSLISVKRAISITLWNTLFIDLLHCFIIITLFYFSIGLLIISFTLFYFSIIIIVIIIIVIYFFVTLFYFLIYYNLVGFVSFHCLVEKMQWETYRKPQIIIIIIFHSSKCLGRKMVKKMVSIYNEKESGQ